MNAFARSALKSRALSLIVALACACLLALALLLALSRDFATSARLFFAGPFTSVWSFGNMLAQAGTLAIAGLAAAVAFGSRNYNLGGEGQVYSGAIACAATCLAMPGAPSWAGIALSLGAGLLAGGLLAWVSGRLRLGLGVDELISSFLVSAAILHVGDFLIAGPLQDATSNFQTTAPVAGAFRLARIFPPSNLGSAAIAALVLVALAAFVSRRTRFGFEFSLVGKNAEFARYAGIETRRYVSVPMALSGALYGLAGALLVLGTYGKAMRGFTAGLGWSGIAVALVAGNSPLAILPSALLFAWLDSGSKAVMIGSDVSGDFVSVIQATVFFLVTARASESLFRKRRPR